MQGLEADWANLADSLKGSHVTVAKYQADVDREFANANLGLKTFPTIVYFPKVSCTPVLACAHYCAPSECCMLMYAIMWWASPDHFILPCFTVQGRSGFVKFPSERRDVDTLRMWVRTVAGQA
jgi:adenylyl-sulfate reductase (glutathione)